MGPDHQQNSLQPGIFQVRKRIVYVLFAADGYHINVSGYAAISEILNSSVFAKMDSH